MIVSKARRNALRNRTGESHAQAKARITAEATVAVTTVRKLQRNFKRQKGIPTFHAYVQAKVGGFRSLRVYGPEIKRETGIAL